MADREERVFISEADQYLFSQGTHYDIYKKLGAHPSTEKGDKGNLLRRMGTKRESSSCYWKL